MKKLFGTILVSALIALSVHAQDLKPSFWIGAAAGANLNYYRGSTQDVNTDLFSYPAFHNGKGVGLYLAPTLVYQDPDEVLGAMLQVGYDSRNGKFEQVTTPCNCPADLKTNLSYITVEPSLRVAPFKGNLYLYGGPRLAFNLGKSFTYNKGASADGLIPAEPTLRGKFANMRSTVVSVNVGLGYDILLSEKTESGVRKQMVLSPFVDFHPYFGQDPRSIETWNVTTLRVGVVLKFGHVKVPKHVIPVVVEPTPVVPVKPKPPVVVVIPKITESYTIFFEFDKNDLNPQAITSLNSLVRDLKANPELNVQIKSYADIRGSDAYNIDLSNRRGAAVVIYLKLQGIAASRVNSKGLGETVVFDRDRGVVNETNYALNRRSDIVVIIK
jgi:outer membrane protein OmpA-like peptidoglycan-associated protein